MRARPSSTASHVNRSSELGEETLGDHSWSAFFERYFSDVRTPNTGQEEGVNGDTGVVEKSNIEGTSPTKPSTHVLEFPERPEDFRRRDFRSFHPIQEWEGYVTDIFDQTFRARIVDLTAGGTVEKEEVDLPIADLTNEQREILAPGRVFRWAIGYLRSMAGTKTRHSKIVFRQLPQWTERELAEADEEARRMSADLTRNIADE